MNSTVKHVSLALVTAAALAVSAYGTTAVNEWRIAANDQRNDQRYVPQSAYNISELNRLDEQISDLKYRLTREPNNQRLKMQLESRERSLRRLGGGN